MSQAVVIPFPRQMTRDEGQDRLRRALEDLQTALVEQKRALGDWRFAMAELGIGVAGLGQALGSYRDNLGAVDGLISGLSGEANRLHAASRRSGDVIRGVTAPESHAVL